MTNSSTRTAGRKMVRPSLGWWVICGALLFLACLWLSNKLTHHHSTRSLKESPKISLAKKQASPQLSVVDLDKVSRELSLQIEKNPSNPSLQNRLGLIYLSLGDYDAAEFCFNTATKLCQDSLANCLKKVEEAKLQNKDTACYLLEASAISVELSAAHSNLVKIYDERGDRQKVIAQLEELNKERLPIKTVCTGSLPVKDRLSPKEARLLAQAEAYANSNQQVSAISCYQEVLATNPKLAFAHDRLGLLYTLQNDFAQASNHWEEAALLNPNSAIIQNNLGLAYWELGFAEKSQRAFQKAVNFDPHLEEAALNLGNVLAERGKVEEAENILKEALRQNPRSARAHNNLATLFALSGNYSNAISFYHKALSIDPSMASAHYGIGIALIKTKNYLPGIKQLKQALALNPKLESVQTKIDEAYRLAAHTSKS